MHQSRIEQNLRPHISRAWSPFAHAYRFTLNLLSEDQFKRPNTLSYTKPCQGVESWLTTHFLEKMNFVVRFHSLLAQVGNGFLCFVSCHTACVRQNIMRHTCILHHHETVSIATLYQCPRFLCHGITLSLVTGNYPNK